LKADRSHLEQVFCGFQMTTFRRPLLRSVRQLTVQVSPSDRPIRAEKRLVTPTPGCSSLYVHVVTRGSLRANRNVQLAYAICQGRPLHSEPCGRAVRSANDPFGCPDSSEHMVAFHRFETTKRRAGTALNRSIQFGQRRPEGISGRQDHRPFNKVLELAHIAWPGIASSSETV
jgi:hypothetical protein